MAATSTFGSLIGRNDVEQHIIDTLQTPPVGSAHPLIAYHLAEVERREGLNPRTLPIPSESSFRGGLDFETFNSELLPLLIVVSQPTGDAERIAPGLYAQHYATQIACVVEDQDEPSARLMADRYGKAVSLLIAQNGKLGTRIDEEGVTVPFAVKTVLTSMPRAEFVNPLKRQFARSVVPFESLIVATVTEEGPTTFSPDPYDTPTPWPTVSTVNVTVVAKPLGS